MNFRLNKQILSIVMVLLIIVATIGVNFIFGVLGSKVNLNIDLTKEKILEFSDLTKQTIENLDTEIRIKSLIPKGSYDDYGIFDSIDLLLKRYDTASDKISYEVVDIQKDPTVFQKYKDKNGNNAPEYSVIFESDKGYEIVDTTNIFEELPDFKDPTSQIALFGGEQMFTTALEIASGGVKPVIYVVEGHGEYAMQFNVEDKVGSAGFIDYILEGQPFEVKSLDLSKDDVPKDASVVMILSPQTDYSSSEISRLDAYLSKGGKAIVVASDFDMYGKNENLENYYKEYGVSFYDGIIIDSDENNQHLFEGSYYMMPDIEETDITYSIVKKEGKIIVQTARGIDIESKKNVTSKPLLLTSSNTAIYSGGSIEDVNSFVDIGKTPLASLVTKTNADATQTNILFLSGSEFLNPLILGQTTYSNYDFMVNAAKYLTPSSSELAIVPKDVTPSIMSIDVAEAKTYTWIVVIVIPAIILLIGLFVFIRRKNKWFQKKG